MSPLKGTPSTADQARVPSSDSDKPAYLRRRKLIEPRIQVRFFLFFLTISGLAVLVQTIVLNYLLHRLARELPGDGELLLANIPGSLGIAVAVTFALLAPLTFVLGVQTTFPIVGPLYRFRAYLTQIAAGERPGPCHIRKGDELQDLCRVLNRAVASLQGEGADGTPEREATPTKPDDERLAG